MPLAAVRDEHSLERPELRRRGAAFDESARHMDLVVRKARRQRLGEENPKQPLKHRLRAPLFYAGVLGLVLLLQETLYLVLKNPALLADLVNTYASLIAEHVAFAVFAGTFGALAFQSRAWGVASMAMLYYIIVSLRVLYFDAPMLSQTKLAVVFALLSAAFWYTLYRFYRSRRTHAVWVVGVVAFNALLRAIQYTWSSLGGAVGVFLSSFEPLAVVFLGAAMLLGVLFFIDRKNVRRGALAVAVALPCAIIALRSQATGATTESSDS